jgi:UDP-glucose 4-epimerase
MVEGIRNVYSHHQGSITPLFFRQVQAGKELIIYGDGEQTRDFLYVTDLCQAIIAALKADLPFGRALQLGSGQETSINRLVGLMRQVVGKNHFPPVRYLPSRAGESRRNFFSITRAQQYLNFSPQTDLLTGLKDTWNWFQQQGR